MDAYLLQNGDELMIRRGEACDMRNLIDHIKTNLDPKSFISCNQWELINIKDEQFNLIKGLNRNNELFLVAEVKEHIVGYLIFRVGMWPVVLHVGDTFISVHKNYEKFGVGKLLMNQLMFWAKNTKVVRKINIKVALDSKAGIAFYKKLGFKSEGLLRREFYDNGVLRDAVIMGICVEPHAECYNDRINII